MKIRRLLILLLRMLNPDPLSKVESQLPRIDVLIPVALKEIYLLEKVLENLRLNCRNPIGKIYVVTPIKERIKIKLDSNVYIFSDDEYLGFDLTKFKAEHPDLYGWCIQQLIKIKAVNFTEERYLLWLDADTLLNNQRTFVDNKYILEVLSDEFHSPYFTGLKKTLDLKSGNLRFSRVSHHAVVDVDAFRKFESQNLINSIYDWKNVIINSIDKDSSKQSKNWFIFGSSSFSEYELNSLILRKYNVPRKKVYWWNESRSYISYDLNFIEIENGLLEKISNWKRPKKPYSISFHTWRIST